MTGGFVSQEVLDSPEIAKERIRIAAGKAHARLERFWEHPPRDQRFRTMGAGKHEEKYRTQVSKTNIGYDIYEVYTFDISRFGDSYSINYTPPGNPRRGETWRIEPDIMTRTGAVIPLDTRGQSFGVLSRPGVSFEQRDGATSISFTDLDEAEKAVSNFLETVKKLKAPDPGELARDAESLVDDLDFALGV